MEAANNSRKAFTTTVVRLRPVWCAAFFAALFAAGPAGAIVPKPFEGRPSCETVYPPHLPSQLLELPPMSALPRYSPATASTLDILVAYTPDALARLGSVAAMETEIKANINYANQVHRNSGTGVSFSLVHMHALTTNSSDNFNQDLNAATNLDGTWDELLTLKDDFKADAVSVFIGGTQGGTLCGLGWINGAGAPFSAGKDFMFSVVSINPICTRSTLVHEVGHNLGCEHDRPNATTAGFQAFSFGRRFTGNSRQVWHTTMAVPPDREIPFFSSPLLIFDGKPIGVENSEDNVTSIALAAPTAAAFAASVNGTDLAFPAPLEPTRIAAVYKRIGRSRKVRTSVKFLSGETPLFYQPVELYFSRGRKGVQVLRAIGRTNVRGEFKFTETVNVAKNIFYRFCYPGFTTKILCSAPVEIAKVRSL